MNSHVGYFMKLIPTEIPTAGIPFARKTSVIECCSYVHRQKKKKKIKILIDVHILLWWSGMHVKINASNVNMLILTIPSTLFYIILYVYRLTLNVLSVL